ncbi:MAG: NADH-quinone oxidoreductase subunit NuoH [Elusimicrobia bacterium]|nr:NADH-quinone oxidoreductase subunit NuoH [Elusimicrobiota bacterium]
MTPAEKPVYPEPVLNRRSGKLLTGTRYWPTELWRNPWSLPRYRAGALWLAGIVLGIAAVGAGVGELAAWGEKLLALLGRSGLPAAVVAWVWVLVKLTCVIGVIVANGLWAVWWERKISAHIQSRMGPMYAGGFHGWAQTILDTIKLLLKEDVTPAAADQVMHLLAPIVAIAPCVMAFAPVLFGDELAAARIDVGVLYVFAFASISVIGVVMAGWASGNKYSLLGGLRAAAQIVSYELPRGFSVVPVLMFASSLDLAAIDRAQAGYWLGFFPRWFIFYPVAGQLAFIFFLIASVAETNRTPFDIPEAESELVAGFHTEFSGMKWSLFFLMEYGYVLLASFLLAVFFLGGGAAPLPHPTFIPAWLSIPSWIWMTSKAMLMMFVFLWFRWTFPRLRVDQLMDFNWKFLLPWSFANIGFAGVLVYLHMRGWGPG